MLTYGPGEYECDSGDITNASASKQLSLAENLANRALTTPPQRPV